MDYHFTPDTVAGFALGGGGTSWGLAQGLGGGRSDAFQAGIYGTTRLGPAYLAAALAFANHWMTTDRIAFAGDQLDARFNAQSYGARIETGYRYAVLPAAGLYKPITEYDRVTLAKDLSAHLVYGLTTAATFKALLPRAGRDR